MRILRYAFLVMATTVCMSAAAQAQSPYGTTNFSRQKSLRRSAVSPYVNLLQGSEAGVSNYFTRVRPQLRQRTVNTQQLANMRSLRHQVAGATVAGQAGSAVVRQTGHITTFRNYSHFFPSLVRGNSAGGRAARR